MSVVISYYNDRFALILTDRMVTSLYGHWEEQKLYNIHSYPYGACAGVGLANGIYTVRDVLSSPIQFNDIDEINKFVKSRPELKKTEFESYTAFSVGLTVMEETSIEHRPTIFTFRVCSDGNKIFTGRDRNIKNQFEILYPSTYLADQALYDRFIAENDLSGDDSYSAERAFNRAKELFSIIQQNSNKVVSKSGDVSLLRYDQHSNKFKTVISSF